MQTAHNLDNFITKNIHINNKNFEIVIQKSTGMMNGIQVADVCGIKFNNWKAKVINKQLISDANRVAPGSVLDRKVGRSKNKPGLYISPYLVWKLINDESSQASFKIKQAILTMVPKSLRPSSATITTIDQKIDDLYQNKDCDKNEGEALEEKEEPGSENEGKQEKQEVEEEEEKEDDEDDEKSGNEKEEVSDEEKNQDEEEEEVFEKTPENEKNQIENVSKQLVIIFSGKKIRIIMQTEKPYFVIKDLCKILDIKNHRDVVGRLDDDEKDYVDVVDAIGRCRKTAVATESGMYRIVFESSKPDAKSFRKWVTGEVLPSIRKHGADPVSVALTKQPCKLQTNNVELVLNNVNIIRRASDGYIDATALCKAGEKLFKHWNENARGKAFVQVLSDAVGISADELIKQEGGANENQRTWVHPQVAINIAQWISPIFDVQISKWIEGDPIILQQKLEEEQKKNRELENKVNNIPTSDAELVLNNVNIIRRASDGYINATALCQAGGKLLANWKSRKAADDFLNVLSATIGIPIDDLIKQEGGANGSRHTWVHPQVAINIAQWISPIFDVQVSKWIYELAVFGKVELGNEHSNDEIEAMRKQLLDIQQEKQKLIENTAQREKEVTELTTKLNKSFVESERELAIHCHASCPPANMLGAAPGAYILAIMETNDQGNPLYRFGQSSTFAQRIKQHDEGDLIGNKHIRFIPVQNALNAESLIKEELRSMSLLTKFKKNGVTHREIFFTTPEQPLPAVVSKLEALLLNKRFTNLQDVKVATLETELECVKRESATQKENYEKMLSAQKENLIAQKENYEKMLSAQKENIIAQNENYEKVLMMFKEIIMK